METFENRFGKLTKLMINKYFVLFYFLIVSLHTCVGADILIECKDIVDTKNLRLLNKHFILIQNNKIIKISHDKIKTNATHISLKEFYIFPGLIDSHSHVFSSQKIEDRNYSSSQVREALMPLNKRTSRAQKYLTQYLNEGFTTLFDLGNSGQFLDADLRNKISNDPMYPLMFVSGPGLSSFKGQFDRNVRNEIARKEYQLLDEKSDINNILALYIGHKVDILKIYLDNLPGEGAMDKLLLSKLLTSPLISRFKKVTFHSLNDADFQLIKKYNIKHLEHFNYFTPDMSTPSLEFVTLTDLDKDTLLKFNEYNPARFLVQTNRAKRIHKSNLKILFGPDFYFDSDSFEVDRGKYVKQSIRSWTTNGFSAAEILRSMTYYPALSLHEENNFGQVTENSFANILGSKMNPLQDTSALYKIEFIMNKGRIIKNSARTQ